MTAKQTNVFLILATLILVVVAVATALFSLSNGLKDPGAALTLITLSAVGIERIIEGFWTYIGLIRSDWWPLNDIKEQVNRMTSGLDNALMPFYQRLELELAQVKSAAGWTPERVTAVENEITASREAVNQLKASAPGDQQTALLLAAATQRISSIQKTFPGLDDMATAATDVIKSFSDFITTPQDNLGRRLISLYAGTGLGLILAWAFGLDLLQAVLKSSVQLAFTLAGQRITFDFGIALTGLVMGLGSNPTHEVIQVLQGFKKSFKQ